MTSCDAYRDVEEPFVRLFRKHWPDCPFELVVNGETGAVSGFDRQILSGRGKTWSTMLAEALELIHTPYVIMLMNDYYLESDVDTALILKRLEESKKADALNYRLCPDPPRAVKNTAYSISCKAGIWNRVFLLELVKKTKSAWEFERYGSFMFDEKDPRPIMVTEKLEFPFVDAVHKGYWEQSGVDLLKREGIDYDFSVRGLPPPMIRAKEWLKSVIFRMNPEIVTRVQNVFNAGKK